MARGRRASSSKKASRPTNVERQPSAQGTNSNAESDTNDAAQTLMSLRIASPRSGNASGPPSLSTPASPTSAGLRGPLSASASLAFGSERDRCQAAEQVEPRTKRRREISASDVAFPSSSSTPIHMRLGGNGRRDVDAMDVDGSDDVRMVNGHMQPDVLAPALSPIQARSRSFTLANHELPTAPISNPAVNGVRSNGAGPANPETEAARREEGRKSKPRNFEAVYFGNWRIKTWYYSPYPISTAEEDETASGTGKNGVSGPAYKKQRSKGRKNAENGDLRMDGTLPNLWVCEFCFKYMKDGTMLDLHSKKFCHRKAPPGRKAYSQSARAIYEVDGAKDKLYCQNLSLFGKLFIDIKTLFFDCENFLFYVLTEGEGDKDHVLGFFSKEKVSYDDYNLACILVLPPYQRNRYGTLMIEFSYELSRRAGKLGTPERPLSELGLRSYLTFWIQALVQFFRRLLSIQPEDIRPSFDSTRPIDPLLLQLVGAHARAMETDDMRRRRRRLEAEELQEKIWDGELEKVHNSSGAIATTGGDNDSVYLQKRWMRTSANPDGSVTTHAFARCSLEDMSKATGMRMEDIAFALHQSGMLKHMEARNGTVGAKSVVLISRTMVEDVAKRFNIKRMVLETQYVL